jgi:hypothetical protein
MGQTTYTRAEAQTKAGRWVRARVASAGVPQGAIDPPAARAESVPRPTRALSRTHGA